MHTTRLLKTAATGITVVLLAAACGSSSSSTTTGGATAGSTERPAPPAGTAAASVGAGEGELNIVAWAGYAENGSTDPKVNWVTPFDQKSGCKTTVKVVPDPAEVA